MLKKFFLISMIFLLPRQKDLKILTYEKSHACFEIIIELKYFEIKKLCLGIFKVAEFKSETQNTKFKMADSIWQID